MSGQTGCFWLKMSYEAVVQPVMGLQLSEGLAALEELLPRSLTGCWLEALVPQHMEFS